jgi:DNA-binding NarL/FixJ family response regulator
VENLVQAIRTVAAGQRYVDPAIAARAGDGARANDGAAGSKKAAPPLTEREREVLKMVARGFTNKEIAGRLGVGVKSVETYKARGIDKLGLRTRAELVRHGSAHGWLEL